MCVSNGCRESADVVWMNSCVCSCVRMYTIVYVCTCAHVYAWQVCELSRTSVMDRQSSSPLFQYENIALRDQFGIMGCVRIRYDAMSWSSITILLMCYRNWIEEQFSSTTLNGIKSESSIFQKPNRFIVAR